jgi:hypothetical protein
MSFQGWMWGADAAAFFLVVLAGLAEARRGRRLDLDRAGWVPWRGIQVAGFFAMVLFAVLAWKGA